MFRNGLAFRIIGVLLLIGLLVAGGMFVYRAGVAQGVSQAPEVAEAIQQTSENNDGAPMMYGREFGYGYPYHHRGFGFGHHFELFPFGFCASILFLFFFFGFLRMIFFRGWAHKHGHWGKWEGSVPSRFDEWHKRAHGEAPSEDAKKSE